MSMSGFAARGNAVEGSFFRKEQEFALRKQVERLVASGQLPQSALEQASTPLDLANRGSKASTSLVDVPVSELKGRPASDYVYQHIKGVVPGAGITLGFFPTLQSQDIQQHRSMYLQCQSPLCHGQHWALLSALAARGEHLSFLYQHFTFCFIISLLQLCGSHDNKSHGAFADGQWMMRPFSQWMTARGLRRHRTSP